MTRRGRAPAVATGARTQERTQPEFLRLLARGQSAIEAAAATR